MTINAWRTGAVALVAVGVALIIAPSKSTPMVPSESEAVDGAIRFFENRVRERPADVIAGVELASRYLMRFGDSRDIDDVGRAERVLRNVLEVHPGFGPALARLVPVYIARHEFPEALAAALAAFEASPRRATNGLLFDAWFEVGRYDSAVAALNRMDPGSFGYLTRKARFTEQTGRAATARDALHRACRRKHTFRTALRAWCNVRQGDVQLTLGNAESAETLYDNALADRPDYTAALMGRAEAALLRNKPGQAERLYALAARERGGAEGHAMVARLANLRNDQNAEQAAAAAFEQAVSDPRYGRAFWGAHAMHLARRGNTERALDLAERDASQRPGPESYLTLGAVLYAAGHFARARRVIDSAATWSGQSPELLFYAGMIRVATGERDSGVSYLERALDGGLFPDDAAAARRATQHQVSNIQ